MNRTRSNVGTMRCPSVFGALMLGAIVCFASHRVVAATLVDTLDSWSHTSGHSPSLVLDTSNPEYFNNDNSRVKLDYGYTTGSFGYHLKDISAFAGYIYYWKDMGVVEAYASPDNSNWTKIPISFAAPALIASSWYVMAMEAHVPDGTNYLGFTITSQPEAHPADFTPDQVFTPQIGQINIQYAGANIPAPTGLTALAAAAQVALNWLPTTTATSYAIKRSTDGETYHVIAEDITGTSYIDDTAKIGKSYYYGISAESQDGSSDISDPVTATPKAGTVVFSDSLTDMALITGHTKNLTNGSVGRVSTVKRSKSGVESFYYNMPGMTDFAFNVYYSGDLKGQISADVSSDGNTWQPLPLANSDPVAAGQGVMVTVCSPLNKLPNDSNYLRFDLGTVDDSDTDSPQVAQVRLTYGQAQHKAADAGISLAKPSVSAAAQ